MAELSLSPEEQLMSSVGATDAPMEAGFDLTGALQEGYSPAEIADYLAQQRKFDVVGARNEGYTDNQILAHLLGETRFSAGVKRFVESAGSSIKGIAQLSGMADTERLRAERQAAEIASANAPYVGGTAMVLGAIADPINIPAPALGLLKGATLVGTLARQGAAQGALGGYLEPVLKEGEDTGFLSAERFKGAAFGTAAGAALGAGLGAGAEALVRRLSQKAADVDVPVAAAAESQAVKASSDAAIADVAKAIETPAYLRATEGRGITELAEAPRGIDEKTTKLLEDKITKAEADIARAEERLFEMGQKKPDTQVAALLKGTPLEETPIGMGLVERASRDDSPKKQLAALFRPTQEPKAPEKIREDVVQVAKLTSGEDYLKNIISQRQTEIENIRGILQRGKRLETFPVQPKAVPEVAANKNKPEVIQPETKKPLAADTLTDVEKQQVTQLQKVLDDNGFKNMDEAIVATGRPQEVAAARERIKSGNVQTLEQIVRGLRSSGSASPLDRAALQGSAGSARTDPYLMLAEDVPFATNPERAFSPTYRGKIEAAPVSADEAINSLHMKSVAAAGKAQSALRGRAKAGGSLESTAALGEKKTAAMIEEEGSVLEWALKNADKSWNREELAAFVPQYIEARDFLKAQIDEYVNLKNSGQLTEAMEQTIMHRSQVPLGVMSIFQGQRTKASDTLNAFKLAYNEIKAGKNVTGFASPKQRCN